MHFIPHTAEQRARMLEVCGVDSIDALFADIPPALAPQTFNLGEPCSELEALSALKRLSQRNAADATLFLGGGVYDHFIPAAVDAVASNGAFYTAYTPYQPERAQGTLQAMYEYQSQICRLTGMEAANASVWDGGTAIFEACRMAVAATRRRRIVVAAGVNPLYRDMLRTHTANLGLTLELLDPTPDDDRDDFAQLRAAVDDNTAAVVLQNPNFFGSVANHAAFADDCRERGALTIQSVYPIALALAATPGEQGIDIATGEGQSLGNPLAFGGPYLGFMATRGAWSRRLPGRIAGRTLDRLGREAFVLTMQAREQHIRREKAGSNICTNQALCALRAHAYLSLLGREGLTSVASLCRAKACYARERLGALPGVCVDETVPIFNEFTLRLPMDAGSVADLLLKQGIAAGLPLGAFYPLRRRDLLVAVTEQRSREEIDALVDALGAVLSGTKGAIA